MKGIASVQQIILQVTLVFLLILDVSRLSSAVPTRPRWLTPCAGSTPSQIRGTVMPATASTLDLRRHYTIMAERASASKSVVQGLRDLYATERYAIPNPELVIDSMPVIAELNGMDVSAPQEQEILQNTYRELAQSVVHLTVSRQGEALYEQGHYVPQYERIENELYWHMCALHIGMSHLTIDLPSDLEETVASITFMDSPTRAQRHMIDSVILRDISKILHKSEHQFQLLSTLR